MTLRKVTPDQALHMAKYCASINLRNAARAVTRHYDRSLSAVGITAVQLPLLAAISYGANTSIAALAEALDLERSTISRDLEGLVRRGLVKRETSGDKRVTALQLTPKGHAALSKAFEAWNRAHDAVINLFGEAELQSLLTRMRRLGRLVSPKTAAASKPRRG